MWDIKLKGFRQAGLRCSLCYDNCVEDGKDDNVKEDNDSFNMNDKDNLF